MGRRLREFWLGSTDLAPLSLFRILYGVQFFNWIWQLYPNLSAFFTDEGILPRRELMVTFADRFSLLLSRAAVPGRRCQVKCCNGSEIGAAFVGSRR